MMVQQTESPGRYELQRANQVARYLPRELKTSQWFKGLNGDNCYLGLFDKTENRVNSKVYSLLKSLPQINQRFQEEVRYWRTNPDTFWGRVATSDVGRWTGLGSVYAAGFYAWDLFWAPTKYLTNIVRPNSVEPWVPGERSGFDIWADGLPRSASDDGGKKTSSSWLSICCGSGNDSDSDSTERRERQRKRNKRNGWASGRKDDSKTSGDGDGGDDDKNDENEDDTSASTNKDARTTSSSDSAWEKFKNLDTWIHILIVAA